MPFWIVQLLESVIPPIVQMIIVAHQKRVQDELTQNKIDAYKNMSDVLKSPKQPIPKESYVAPLKK